MMKLLSCLILVMSAVLLSSSTAAAFSAHPRVLSSPRSSSSCLHAKKKKKKGFGETQSDKPKNVSSSSTTVQEDTKQQQRSLNTGQKALEEMRRERAEKKDAELRKLREMLETDQQVQEAPAAIPEQVAQRMGQRMLPFVGVPLFLGMGAFVGFWYLATYQNMEFQPTMVAASTILILVVGLLGITYSVMSASWDPDREGTLLGTEEFSRNVDNIKEGLSRSKENAMLRDKMADMSESEIQKALTDLEQRDSTQSKKTQTLKTKLQDELE